MTVLIDKQVAIDALGEQGLITAMIVIDRLPSAQPEITEDDVKEYCRKRNLTVVTSDFYADELERIKQAMRNTPVMLLPSAQPEQHTCVNCDRTVNNGGWYADGRTRCPIEEHYALPKDGYCHLWEKRNVTDDDYPERRTDECTD